jgi:hypothetical protein
MTKLNQQRNCMKLKMFHQSGDVLYPVKMKNKDTGLLAFRVSAAGNKKEDSIEVEDEQSMLDYVVKKRYAVRATSLTAITGSSKKRSGLYRLDQQSIVKHQLI